VGKKASTRTIVVVVSSENSWEQRLPAVVVKTGPEAGRRVELGVEVAIGRQDGDLVLQDPEVSRRHAVLRRSGQSVVVEDLDSTNGTFVNGERIRSPITLGPGDQVRVGGTTLEIESDRRAEDTMVSMPLRPDQIRSVEARPSSDPLADEDEDATQPLPSRILDVGSRPARSNRSWLGVLAFVLAVLLGVIAYVGLVDRPAGEDFAASANDACAAVQRPEADVDLSRTPTRGELQGARNIRLQALGAIRALDGSEQDAVLVGRFLSAFGETNASIARLERAIGADDRHVVRALGSLRGDVRDERELAARASMAGCGGLAIR
jgi:pSer/pThr/pTyr-binding forkhead associated (FHA) protein